MHSKLRNLFQKPSSKSEDTNDISESSTSVRLETQGKSDFLDELAKHFLERESPDGNCVVKAFAEMARNEMCPPRQAVQWALREDQTAQATDLALFPSIRMLFLDDLELQRDGSLLFGKQVSSLLRSPPASIAKEIPLKHKKWIVEKSSNGDFFVGKVVLNKNAGYSQPVLSSVRADYVSANRASLNILAKSESDEFMSQPIIRLALPETVLAASDLSWSEDGCLTVKNLAARNIFAAAQLYIPSDHDVLRDYDALSSNTEDGLHLKDWELHGTEAAKVDTLRELLAQRNRVWIVDCNLNDPWHSVSINYRYTEEFDDARFAHDNGVVARNFLRELVEGRERRACCSNRFGSLSLHEILERLVVLCWKATTREEGERKQSERGEKIFRRAKGQAPSPLIDMFENSQPRNGRDSSLEVAISGLQAYDRQQQEVLKDSESTAQKLKLKGLELKVQRLELDEAHPDFDIQFQEFLDLRIKINDARTRKGSFFKRKLSWATSTSSGKRRKFFNRPSRVVSVPIITTNEKASPAAVDVERSLTLPDLDKVTNSPEKKVPLTISFSRSSCDSRAKSRVLSPLNILKRIFSDESLFDEPEEMEGSSPITSASTSPRSNSFGSSLKKSSGGDDSDWKPPAPARTAITTIQWAPSLSDPSSSSSSLKSQMVNDGEPMVQNRASRRPASILDGVITCCSTNVKDKKPEVDALEEHKEPEVDEMEVEDGKIAEAMEAKLKLWHDYECTLDNLCHGCCAFFRICGELPPGKKSAIVEKAPGWFVWPGGPRCILHREKWVNIAEEKVDEEIVEEVVEEFEEVEEVKKVMGLPWA